MPWQGNKENMIDRFDGRAHLDYIPEVIARESDEEFDRHELRERRLANYERYRILVQNDFLKSNIFRFRRRIFPSKQDLIFSFIFAIWSSVNRN